MIFDWKNYLELARSLQKLNLNKEEIKEACYRTAVSRAYYAIFNITLDFAEKKLEYVKLLKEEAGKNHRELKKHYQQQPNLDYKKIGKILGRMRNDRTVCDYENEVLNTKLLMDHAILSADDALTIIEK